MSESVGLLSRVLLFATVDRQAPLPVEFSGREYWSGLPFPSPGDLSDPAVELGDLALQADCLPSEALIRYQGDVLSQRKACEDTGRRGATSKPEGRPHEKPADTFILDFQPLELEKKIWLFQPLNLGYFVMAALAHQSSLHGQHHSTSLTIFLSSQISSLPIFCSKCECSDTSMIRLGPLR